MSGLFAYHNGPRGDVMFCRAVYRALAASGRFDLVLGACRDDAALLEDLAGERCRVVASDFANTPHGAVLDLVYLCPDGCTPLEVWLGGDEEWASYQWADVADSLCRDLRARGFDFEVEGAEHEVPMLDFAREVAIPALLRPSIYVDNARTAHPLCHFVLDLDRLLDALPGFDLVCTAPSVVTHDRIVDVSRLSPVELQKLSDRCAVLVGLTWDPFNLTLTEPNRWKAKALCGYDARVHAPLWDYAGNPLELLGTMDELVDFLRANAVERCA